MQDGKIYKGDQVVVPESLRADYLRRSHLGNESTLRRARDAVYWPNMAADITKVTAQCPKCEEDSPAQAKQRLMVHEIPKEPYGARLAWTYVNARGKITWWW